MKIFISHSSVDAELAAEVCRRIEAWGYPCFLAPRDIPSGKEYAEALVEGIDESSLMVLLMSKRANESPHVLREVERAVSHNIPILVYKIEEVELSKSMEYFLMTHQWIDATVTADVDAIVRSIVQTYGGGASISASDSPKVPDSEYRNKPTPTSTPRVKPAIVIIGITMVAVLIVVLLILLAVLLSDRIQDSDTDSAASSLTASENAGDDAAAGDEAENEAELETLALGDTVTLGSYLDSPITWQVLHYVDSDTVILLSSDILCMKAFDGAEDPDYDMSAYGDNYIFADYREDADAQKALKGSSTWAGSNISTWLNASSQVVSYILQGPTRSAVSDAEGAYDAEAGFLSAFSEEELALLAEYEPESGCYDSVFLLSEEELDWLEEADISLYAKPSEALLASGQWNGYYESYSDLTQGYWQWWLRDACTEAECRDRSLTSYTYQSFCDVKLVVTGYEYETLGSYVYYGFANIASYGIRPAIAVDVDALQAYLAE